MEKDMFFLTRIRGIANYQFDGDVGQSFFPDEVTITRSKRTGRVRHVFLDKVLLVTLRPTNGYFSLTIDGARRLCSLIKPPRFRVVVQSDIEEFVKQGRNVFARHVVSADAHIQPGEEVIVTDEYDTILAVGKAVLTGREMPSFKKGVAVKVRKGVGEVEP